MHVGKPGQDAFITGDMIHSPIQARYPELGMCADHDSKQAGVSRREMFERFCDTSTLMCMAHFPSPSMGRIDALGRGLRVRVGLRMRATEGGETESREPGPRSGASGYRICR